MSEDTNNIKEYGTTGFIEHNYKENSCCGCITVKIDGEQCILECNECGTILGAGSLER